MPSQTFIFPEVLNNPAERAQAVTIPSLKSASITAFTPSDATVRYTVVGDSLTVFAGGGSPTRSVTNPTKFSTNGSGSRTSSVDSFPTTIAYNSGGYSGNIGKSGASFVASGTFIPADTKTDTENLVCAITWSWIFHSGSWVQNGWTHSTAPTLSYSDTFGYVGTLPRTNVNPGTRPAPPGAFAPEGQITVATVNSGVVTYSGPVTKPAIDTRVYQQNYSGTVFAPGTDSYYSYSVTVDYIVNTVPDAGVITFPVSGAGYLINTIPRVKFSVTDPDGNACTLEIQIATDPAFTTIILYRGSSAFPTEFSPNGAVPSGTTSVWTYPTGLGYGTYYVRVRGNDGVGFGAWSATTTFTIQNPNWSNPGILDNDPGIRKVWIDEIRTHISNIRLARGLTAFTFTNSAVTADSTAVRKIHIDELRSVIAQMRSVEGYTVPTWTDATITTDVTVRKGKHIKELRTYIETG